MGCMTARLKEHSDRLDGLQLSLAERMGEIKAILAGQAMQLKAIFWTMLILIFVVGAGFFI